MSGEGNGLATREQLLSATAGKRRFNTVMLPVSELFVRIRSLTERELSEYQSEAIGSVRGGYKKSKFEDASRRFIVLCAVDADGNQLFQTADISVLAKWDAADSNFLYDKCAEWVGLNRQDADDLGKNSEQTPADAVLSE
jgi:hypothetical protein